jgi:predicted RNase H-like HicB family nuclease
MTNYTINFEDGTYVFEYRDEYGFVTTDGSSIEQLWYNIKEAMQLHFEWVSSIKWATVTNDWVFKMPVNLSFSPDSYAFNLQGN